MKKKLKYTTHFDMKKIINFFAWIYYKVKIRKAFRKMIFNFGRMNEAMIYLGCAAKDAENSMKCLNEEIKKLKK